MPQRPDCLSCSYFFVTWDPTAPRGCRLFEIKTPRLPSEIVFQATGRHCPSYRKKKGVKKAPPGEGSDGGPGILV